MKTNRYFARKLFRLPAWLAAFFAPVLLGQEKPVQTHSRTRMPIFAFEAHASNPILVPQGNSWQSEGVIAPAAIVKADTLFLLYEGEEGAGFGVGRSTGRIGLAFSTDGVSFTRAPQPLLIPTLDVETPGGCRNPRVVFSGGTYYMTYSAYDGQTMRLALATSSDLRRWKKRGLILPDTGATSGGAIFSEKINGRFIMYYGKHGDIRVAYSNDLSHWFPQTEPVLQPRPGKFDGEALWPGPPPILVDSAIVFLYNARDASGRHACGLALFSKDDPVTVLARAESPLFPPPQQFEAGELRPLAVSGLVWFLGQYELFYSGPRAAIALAKGRLLYEEKR